MLGPVNSILYKPCNQLKRPHRFGLLDPGGGLNQLTEEYDLDKKKAAPGSCNTNYPWRIWSGITMSDTTELAIQEG